MDDPRPRNGNSFGLSWGDKSIRADGPLALAVLMILIFGVGGAYGVYLTFSEIRAAGKAISESNREGFAVTHQLLARMEQGQKTQSDGIEANQNLANCLQTYDFAGRERIRRRAEDGTLNLDAWCRWMSVLSETNKDTAARVKEKR